MLDAEAVIGDRVGHERLHDEGVPVRRMDRGSTREGSSGPTDHVQAADLVAYLHRPEGSPCDHRPTSQSDSRPTLDRHRATLRRSAHMGPSSTKTPRGWVL